MDHPTFNDVVETQLERCRKVLGLKSEEYSTADKLHNFKVAGHLQQCTPEAACGGMMAKHIVSVYDLIRRIEEHNDPTSMDMWDEKLTDAINYLLLLKALVVERDRGTFVININYGDSVIASGEGRNYEKCVHCGENLYTDGLVWRHRNTNLKECQPDKDSYAYPS